MSIEKTFISVYKATCNKKTLHLPFKYIKKTDIYYEFTDTKIAVRLNELKKHNLSDYEDFIKTPEDTYISDTQSYLAKQVYEEINFTYEDIKEIPNDKQLVEIKLEYGAHCYLTKKYVKQVKRLIKNPILKVCYKYTNDFKCLTTPVFFKDKDNDIEIVVCPVIHSY